MNKKNYNILIIESSDIIYKGLVEILLKDNKNFHFIRCSELNEIYKDNLINNIDIVIVNYQNILNNYKLLKTLQKENEKINWVVLINSYYESKHLEPFNAILFISDKEEKINLSINKLTEIDKGNVKQEALSAREIEILKLLVEGYSAKEIAEKLYLSTHTVVTHRKNISQKTGIKSVAGLTIYAVLNNIVDPESYG